MRLFYAIDFDPATCRSVQAAITQLRNQVQGGRWTPPDHWHLTLAFLGEIQPDRLGGICELLDRTAAQTDPFTLTFSGCGTFGRQNDILWIGVQQEPALLQLTDNLRHALTALGIEMDTRPYRPHLTVARQIRLTVAQPVWQVPPILYRVDDTVLMESTRLDGRLVYRPVCRAPLGQAVYATDHV